MSAGDDGAICHSERLRRRKRRRRGRGGSSGSEESKNNAGVVSAGHGIKAPGGSQRPLSCSPAQGQGERGQAGTTSLPSPHRPRRQMDKKRMFKKTQAPGFSASCCSSSEEAPLTHPSAASLRLSIGTRPWRRLDRAAPPAAGQSSRSRLRRERRNHVASRIQDGRL